MVDFIRYFIDSINSIVMKMFPQDFLHFLGSIPCGLFGGTRIGNQCFRTWDTYINVDELGALLISWPITVFVFYVVVKIIFELIKEIFKYIFQEENE